MLDFSKILGTIGAPKGTPRKDKDGNTFYEDENGGRYDKMGNPIMYTGGSPYFDERTGRDIRYEYDENGNLMRDENGNPVPRQSAFEKKLKKFNQLNLGRSDSGTNLEKMPTTNPEPTFPNNEEKIQTPGTSIPVTKYITDINNGLNKLVKSGKIFSPVQQRKIAKLYTNARNKYKTSSQSEEETNAFNALKSNPIWRSFNNNK